MVHARSSGSVGPGQAIEPEQLGPVGRNCARGESDAENGGGGAPAGDRATVERDGVSESPGPAPYWDPLALFATTPVAVVQTAPPLSSSAPALEPVIAEVVRSIAWGGDRRRGSARLTLAGRFEGASIRIDASEGRLDVEVQAPPGIDANDLLGRLGERLRARGLEVDSLTVR